MEQSFRHETLEFVGRVAEYRLECGTGELEPSVGSDDDHDVAGAGDERREAPLGSAQLSLEGLSPRRGPSQEFDHQQSANEAEAGNSQHRRFDGSASEPDGAR